MADDADTCDRIVVAAAARYFCFVEDEQRT